MNRINLDLNSKTIESRVNVQPSSSLPTGSPQNSNQTPKQSLSHVSSQPVKTKPRKKSTARKILLILGLLFVFTLALMGSQVYALLKDTNFSFNPLTTIIDTAKGETPQLKQTNGYTNALIVGIDTRETGNLQNTDTMMVASYNHSTNEVLLISLPRDLWVKYPNEGNYYNRINGVYNSCENDQEGNGLECLKQVASEITGLPIHYYGMVDLKGFRDAIDRLEGIDVYVERSFTDYMYPGPNNSYMTVSFEEGWQHMDGETALQYARSRKSQSIEGSDYMRMKRQQKVIKATVEKAMTIEDISDVPQALDILNTFKVNVKVCEFTDTDVRAAIELSKKIDEKKIYGINIDPNTANGTLIYRPSDAETGGMFVLFSREGQGKWDNVQTFIRIVLKKPALYDENAKIYVYNGGLGYQESASKVKELQEANEYIKIVYGGNAAKQDYIGKLVYDFSDKGKPATVNLLVEQLKATAYETIPEDLRNPYAEDIVVILGAESQPSTETTSAGNTNTTE